MPRNCCSLQEVEAITLELEELKREHISYKQQLEAVIEAIQSYEGQIEVMAAEVAKNKVRYDVLLLEKLQMLIIYMGILF